ncbi:hypothetical protein JTE90_019385 [Oedothorax gibbosus]|uniref:Endonuclease/exonuclease/phosphatase family domain-containing protein 1 n=1 Tax=Oedothorax gibbosus TaxID=931172 RepID=A0AAV6UAU8_9ARAC|nr:hypothetical protein JTE90_019385 [Oedothorax gibbosus]
MGQCVSATDDPSCRDPANKRRPFYRGKGNLSATFHVLDADLRWDLLNVNAATEEQLMTLPGVTRPTAENILEYRARIGGFKKVEDLALVSGVGATKLELFRTEVCVGRRKANNGSYNSSLTQSMESLTDLKEPKKVNVNTANVFQLMSVCRMTQEMAANIAHHRERKGPFKTLSDLSKVKGLPPDRLAIVKMYLTTDSSVINGVSNGSTRTLGSGFGQRPVGHRRTNSAPSGLSKLKSCDASTRDFYELVSSLVTRPPAAGPFRFEHLGRRVVRLASWNLQEFVVQKARNPGVQEVICRTILENGLSIVAVQEIASREALSLIASELNEPKLYNVQSWSGDRGKWHSLVPSPQTNGDNSHKRALVNGFLYDTSRGLQLQSSEVLYIPPEKLMGLTVTCQPFLGCFKIKNLEFAVVTFSLVSETCVAKLLPSILEQLKEKVQGKKNIFLVGDFILPPGHTVFEVLCSQGYTNLIPVENSSNDPCWHEESHIWSSLNVRKIFTGQSGVVSEGLRHLAIPDAWKWGGTVSKHRPVWAELFADDPPTNSTAPPLMNGNCKVVGKDNDDTKKGRSSSFWDRSWPWRHSNNNNRTAQHKGNGSL